MDYLIAIAAAEEDQIGASNRDGLPCQARELRPCDHVDYDTVLSRW